jgi:hypothetical protein
MRVSFFCDPFWLKQKLNVSAQMIDTTGSDFRVAFSLCQDEGTLQNRLRVKCEARCRAICAYPVNLHRFCDIL